MRAAAAPSQVTPTARCTATSLVNSAQPPRAAYVPPRPARVSAFARPEPGGRSSAAPTRSGATTAAMPDANNPALLNQPRLMRATLLPQRDSDERRSVVEPDLRPCADHGGLKVAPADTTADRIFDAHDRVTNLVDALSRRAVRAIGDVLALDMQFAAPLAVVVSVQSEVETEPKMHARVTQCGHGHG